MKNIVISLLIILSKLVCAQQTPVLETFTLKNGLKVYIVKYGKIEAINIKLMINSGKKNEVPGQQGYSAITANLLLEGNKKYTKDVQDDKAFQLGATLSTSADMDYTSIEGNFLSKNTDEVMDLFSAAILQPNFSKDAVEQIKNYTIESSQFNKMDITDLADVFSDYAIFGLENPLGRYQHKSQLQGITPEKIRSFYEFNYTPKNARLVITGNCDVVLLKNLIEKYFGAWQSTIGEINGVALDAPKIKKKEIGFINRANATQCALQWNKVGPAAGDKDAIPFKVANAIFNEVLFEEIREKGGKTYSIGSRLSNAKYANILNISCSVRSNEMFNTIQLFDKTLAAFYANPPLESRFETTVNNLKTQIMSQESPEAIASIYNPVRYNFEKQSNMLKELSNLKIEDVLNVIKKYFSAEAYKLVISGDEVKVRDQLSQIKSIVTYTPSNLE